MSNIFDQLDGSIYSSAEEDWDSDYAAESSALIHRANETFSLTDYLDSRMSFQVLNSSNGWSRKTFCPFHKHGHERTPSFFVNSKKNRFFCQGCGVTGGLVQYISMKFNRPEEFVAIHILELSKTGNARDSINESQLKLEQQKKVVKKLFELSDLFRAFISTHLDDDVAIKYVNSAMEGFDSAHHINPEGVETNINEIVKNFQSFLAKYDRKAE